MIAVYYLLTILCTILLLASVISSISCLTNFNRFCLKWRHFFICIEAHIRVVLLVFGHMSATSIPGLFAASHIMLNCRC